jgi:LCP family protein required for cell wall assembly
MSWVALTMSVLILFLAAAGWMLIRHYDGNIDRIGGVFKRPDKAPAAAPKNAMNVLLVGSDTRAGENAKGTGGKGFAPGQRSDTIILAHLYGSSDKALMVSFPRDSWVEIPAYTNEKTGRTRAAHRARINTALGEGGPSLLVRTVENLSNIRIDHYVQVDFVGFKGMVDKLGGVDICLSKDVDDPHSYLKLDAGRHHVNGDTALKFARTRYSFAGGDLDRIKHQQQLIGAMVSKVLSAGTLLNPLKLNGFLNEATSSLDVDEKLSFNGIRDIALRMRGFSSGNVLFTTVPVADARYRTAGGASVVKIDEAEADAMFTSLRQDKAPGSPAVDKPAPSNLIVKPGAVRVRVYNGSGVAGLARRAFRELTDVGFATTGTPTNRGEGAATTYVYYGPKKADSARTLAAAIPGAVLQEDPSLGRTLEVVVGSDFVDKHARTVTVTGTPGPKPSATPGVKVRTAADDICT